jgi:hypothetical protein
MRFEPLTSSTRAPRLAQITVSYRLLQKMPLGKTLKNRYFTKI